MALSQNLCIEIIKVGGILMTWRIISGFSKYETNEEGQIRNRTTEHIMTQRINNSGYKVVAVRDDDGRRRWVQVSRMVGTAWIPNPNNLPEIDHLDGNPLNNALNNLEWVSKEENVLRKKKIHKKGVSRRVRPVAQYDLSGNLIKVYPSMKDAERETGIRNQCISRVVRGEYGRKTTGGYVWRYWDEENISGFSGFGA